MAPARFCPAPLGGRTFAGLRKAMKNKNHIRTLKRGGAGLNGEGAEVLQRERAQVWAANRWSLLERQLIVGSETGVYTGAVEESLCETGALGQLAGDDAPGLVRTLNGLFAAGEAVRTESALQALAFAAAFGSEEGRALAFGSLARVARSGPDLMSFVADVTRFRGWGRGLRRAVGDWYLNKDVDELAIQVAKGQTRRGYSHADLLRLAHPVPKTAEHSAVLRWAVEGAGDGCHPLLSAVDALRKGVPTAAALRLIGEHKVPWEAVPDGLLCEAEVWRALLGHLPLVAVLDHLATLDRLGLLAEGSESGRAVVCALTSEARLRAGRIGPFQVLLARLAYAGSVAAPAACVLDALDEAYRVSARLCGSMGLRVTVGVGAAGAVASGLIDLWSRTESDLAVVLHGAGAGHACGLVAWAQAEGRETDLFVVLTDGGADLIEAGRALGAYREATGGRARLAVVSLGCGRVRGNLADAGIAGFETIDGRMPASLASFATVGR